MIWAYHFIPHKAFLEHHTLFIRNRQLTFQSRPSKLRNNLVWTLKPNHLITFTVWSYHSRRPVQPIVIQVSCLTLATQKWTRMPSWQMSTQYNRRATSLISCKLCLATTPMSQTQPLRKRSNWLHGHVPPLTGNFPVKAQWQEKRRLFTTLNSSVQLIRTCLQSKSLKHWFGSTLVS